MSFTTFSVLWSLAVTLLGYPTNKQKMSEYVVKDGDNAWYIAKHHGIDVDELQKLNSGQGDLSWIHPGQKLKVGRPESYNSASGFSSTLGPSQISTNFSGGLGCYDYEVLLRTVYGEARIEPERGQRAVAWVIKNRADTNSPNWGGNTIAGVCKMPGQFGSWNSGDIAMNDHATREAIEKWLPHFTDEPDPTGGADHFNNPDTEGYPSWTNNCVRQVRIGNRQFYKCKH